MPAQGYVTMQRVTTERPHAPAVAPVTAGRLRGLLGAYLRLARPRQWIKNLLVLAAPLAAARITEPSTARAAVVALVAFTLVTSGAYWINDALDADADRLHPSKRERPIAAGLVTPRAAFVGGVGLQLSGLLLAVVGSNLGFGIVLASYLLLQVGYNLWLKRVVVVELLIVAAGFVIRAVGGGIATDVMLSEWFLIVTSFGALFAVSGKRYAERLALGVGARAHREALGHYPPAFLQQAVGVCLAVTLLAYCLWAFRTPTDGGSPNLWVALSAVPVTMVLLRYLLLMANGRSGEPEDLLLRDHVLLVGTLLTATMVLIGIYAG